MSKPKNTRRIGRKTAPSPPKRHAPVNVRRRALLGAFLGLPAVAATTWGVVADTFGLAPVMRMAREKFSFGIAIPDSTKAAARAVLGILRHRTSLVPADSNPIVRPRLAPLANPITVSNASELFAYFSKATVEASACLVPLLQEPLTGHYAGYDEVNAILRANPHERILAFGTPTSNSLIRTLMSYREYADPNLGHAYIRNDAIDLPIMFELRRSAVVAADVQRDVWYQPQPFGQATLPPKIPNWGLTIDGQLHLPATDGGGRLLEDFLVISAVPNLLHPSSVERSLPVVCIGGTHGVGTMAVRDLLESELLLPSLESELRSLGNPSFWQAVVRVELDGPGGATKSLRLEKRWIRKIEVDSLLLRGLSSDAATRT